MASAVRVCLSRLYSLETGVTPVWVDLQFLHLQLGNFNLMRLRSASQSCSTRGRTDYRPGTRLGLPLRMPDRVAAIRALHCGLPT
eukprot:IDg1608t1